MMLPSAPDENSLVNATAVVSDKVDAIGDQLWQLELAALAASDPAAPAVRRNALENALTQVAATVLALGALLMVLIRFGGTSPARAAKELQGAPIVIALHGEDTTRTRHLRAALSRYCAGDQAARPPVLLLGRPSAPVGNAAASLNPQEQLAGLPMLRPLSLGSLLCGLGPAIRLLLRGIAAICAFSGPLSFRERVAISYRMAQGAVHACWWRRAASGAVAAKVVFGHTGTADTSQLEQAMQASGAVTVHAVHGVNNGWSFAGLSDVAVFPSGADARLGASLPAYGRCLHLPLPRPAVSTGNGNWALLTSCTHLGNPAFATHGSQPDRDLVQWMSEAATAHGQDPSRVFWRPHPQISLVPAQERERLEQAIADAGFIRWPDDLAYEALGDFSVVVTTPSTVLVDALRLGQPAVVASTTPLQRDVLYAKHPLLVEESDGLSAALARVSDPASREQAFSQAWDAIEPGDRLDLGHLLAAI